MSAVILDILVLLFLAITIYVCYSLNKRIKVLQDSRSELAEIVAEFDSTTQSATVSIAELHKAAERITENMQHRIDKANFIADDLHFLIERAGKSINKMEAAPARGAAQPAAAARKSGRAAAAGAGASARGAKRARSRAEEELAALVQSKDGQG